MKKKTIRQLVEMVHAVVQSEGMDLSPSDVGHIISLFFEGLVHDGEHGANDTLQQIADECASVKDE